MYHCNETAEIGLWLLNLFFQGLRAFGLLCIDPSLWVSLPD